MNSDRLEEKYMLRAVALAKQGEGKTNPNPLVGAVIEKDGEIIGEGFHRRFGDLHAEREALLDCKRRGKSPEGAALYVTLEPCCHEGKQPPCTDAIIQAKIKKVIIASRDPNPLVSGKGAAKLRAHRIEVVEDFMKSECDALNEIFFHYITKKTPFVALKYAMSADGKIATKTGDSEWITGERSRAFVHRLRNKYAAILVGIGTVLHDNPRLTCRIKNGRNPVRIVCDTNGWLPLDCNLVKTAREVRTIAVCAEMSNEKKSALMRCGAEIMQLPRDENGTVDLQNMLTHLGKEKIDSVLVEGGSEINSGFLLRGLVQKIYCFAAPKIFGGAGKSPVGGNGVEKVSCAIPLTLERIKKFDGDVLLEYGVH